jgi:hypothetical protein
MHWKAHTLEGKRIGRQTHWKANALEGNCIGRQMHWKANALEGKRIALRSVDRHVIILDILEANDKCCWLLYIAPRCNRHSKKAQAVYTSTSLV